jgi:hypothetical protein
VSGSSRPDSSTLGMLCWSPWTVSGPAHTAHVRYTCAARSRKVTGAAARIASARTVRAAAKTHISACITAPSKFIPFARQRNRASPENLTPAKTASSEKVASLKSASPEKVASLKLASPEKVASLKPARPENFVPMKPARLENVAMLHEAYPENVALLNSACPENVTPRKVA